MEQETEAEIKKPTRWHQVGLAKPENTRGLSVNSLSVSIQRVKASAMWFFSRGIHDAVHGLPS